uniref:Uncharacterized protein n=1 Tax=Ficus carica TaxID=3494 RepID=A0AA88CZJ3_FICCA|nr:hypothetical protein TIFTF001_042736 [Ficus carica]GMN38035.1 hypothetical protein TIFTF001_042742 [Ficus carica]
MLAAQPCFYKPQCPASKQRFSAQKSCCQAGPGWEHDPKLAVSQLEEIGGLGWSWHHGHEKRNPEVTRVGITRAGITGLRSARGGDSWGPRVWAACKRSTRG